MSNLITVVEELEVSEFYLKTVQRLQREKEKREKTILTEILHKTEDMADNFKRICQVHETNAELHDDVRKVLEKFDNITEDTCYSSKNIFKAEKALLDSTAKMDAVIEKLNEVFNNTSTTYDELTTSINQLGNKIEAIQKRINNLEGSMEVVNRYNSTYIKPQNSELTE